MSTILALFLILTPFKYTKAILQFQPHSEVHDCCHIVEVCEVVVCLLGDAPNGVKSAAKGVGGRI